jgi:hypothetical protein
MIIKPAAPTILCALAAFGLAGTANAAAPSSKFYPFPGYDLDAVRAKTKAESAPDSPDLAEAWRLYGELQGAWMKGAPRPRAQSIDALDALEKKLEALPNPSWFSAATAPGHTDQTGLADKIGDPVFVAQKATPEYQELKALALVYLTEHELDRPGAAVNASKYLVALIVTHPWDWQVHGLYGRFLVDAQHNDPAWNEALLSLFLNPDPVLGQLKSFAFIGSIAAKSEWPQIQEAMRQACSDDKVVSLAIEESDPLYTSNAVLHVQPSAP